MIEEAMFDDTDSNNLGNFMNFCRFSATSKAMFNTYPELKKFKKVRFLSANDIALKIYNHFKKKGKLKSIIGHAEDEEDVMSFNVIEDKFAFITSTNNKVQGIFIFHNDWKDVEKIIDLSEPRLAIGTYNITHGSMGYGGEKINPQRDSKVILSKGMDKDIKKDIDFFFKNKKVYKDNKFPYKRGILLYGSPGNGKTTMIRNIIETYKDSAYSFLLSRRSNISVELFEFLKNNTKNKPKIVIVEDIDRFYQDDIQTLLNAVDGVYELNNVYIIATCNDLSKVDVALLNRPSRFDKIYLIDDPDKLQRVKLLKMYFPNLTTDEIKECSEASKGLNGAFFKEIFVNSKINKSTAMESIKDIMDRLSQFRSQYKAKYAS